MTYDLTIESNVKITVTDPSWLHVYSIPHNSYMNGLHTKVIMNPTTTFVILSSMLCFFDCILFSFQFLISFEHRCASQCNFTPYSTL